MLQVTYLDYWSNCLIMFPRANMGWTLLLVYILVVYGLCSLPEKLYLQHSSWPEGKEGYKTRGCSYLQTSEKETSEKGKILVRVVVIPKAYWCFSVMLIAIQLWGSPGRGPCCKEYEGTRWQLWTWSSWLSSQDWSLQTLTEHVVGSFCSEGCRVVTVIWLWLENVAGISLGTSSHGSSAAHSHVPGITLKWSTNCYYQLGQHLCTSWFANLGCCEFLECYG